MKHDLLSATVRARMYAKVTLSVPTKKGLFTALKNKRYLNSCIAKQSETRCDSAPDAKSVSLNFKLMFNSQMTSSLLGSLRKLLRSVTEQGYACSLLRTHAGSSLRRSASHARFLSPQAHNCLRFQVIQATVLSNQLNGSRAI